MRLRELQQSFQNRVLRHRRGIESQLNDTPDGDFELRLDAYVGGYRTRLIEALAATYPVLKSTLGDDGFEQEMRLYIDSSHSRHFSIRYYGSGVAQWISRGARLGWEGAALAELARWEWALADVFDAPDDHPLTAEDLSAVVPERWPMLSFSLRACMLAEVRSGATFGSMCERVARVVGEDLSAIRAASILRGWLAEEIIREHAPPSAIEPHISLRCFPFLN
jgi:putative DNA-binding protein